MWIAGERHMNSKTGWQLVHHFEFLDTLDEYTLLPVHFPVGGAVFLATLLLGIGIMRWRTNGEAEQ